MEIKVKGTILKLDEKQAGLLKATASLELDVAQKHRQALAQVLEQAWRAGVLEPDVLGTIFQRINLPGGVDAKFPFDFYGPGQEGLYTAFVCPKEGAIPEKTLDGDEIRVPTYKIANAISWSLDYARDARWDIVARAIEVFTNGFVRKLNDDGWHVVLKAAKENPKSVVTNPDAAVGVFTKKLLLNLITKIKRQAGGRNARLTDLYMSPEAMADILNFDNDTVGSLYLQDLLKTGEEGIPSLYGVNLHELQEFGEGQEFNDYLVTTLGAVLPTVGAGTTLEFVVGMDLQHRDAFVMPVREEMQMFDDPQLHRSAKAGVYGWMEIGFAALDTRRALLGAL